MAALDQPARDVLDRLRVDVNNAPAVTPALLAYLRGLGMDLSTAEDIRAQRIGRLGSDATEAIQKQERAYELARTGTTADLVRRGTLRSGEAGTRFARVSAANQERIADIYSARARGTEEAEQQFATGRDTLRRTALEQLLNAETQQGIQKATSEANTAAIKAQQEAQQKYYDQITALAQKGIAV